MHPYKITLIKSAYQKDKLHLLQLFNTVIYIDKGVLTPRAKNK